MRDMAELAELSHALERVALALCCDDSDDARIEKYLVTMADGEQEAIAVALSYALRRQAEEEDSRRLQRSILALTGALSRMLARGDGRPDLPPSPS